MLREQDQSKKMPENVGKGSQALLGVNVNQIIWIDFPLTWHTVCHEMKRLNCVLPGHSRATFCW